MLMWISGHDFSGHNNRLALISVDIISGVYHNCWTKLPWYWLMGVLIVVGLTIEICSIGNVNHFDPAGPAKISNEDSIK